MKSEYQPNRTNPPPGYPRLLEGKASGRVYLFDAPDRAVVVHSKTGNSVGKRCNNMNADNDNLYQPVTGPVTLWP